MISSKMLTVSLKYKVKDTNNNKLLQQELESLFDSDKFDAHMHIIAKELSVTIDAVDELYIEFLIPMFITVEGAQVKPARLLRAFIEENLTTVNVDNKLCRLVKRRVY